jgi:hypothetical protein
MDLNPNLDPKHLAAAEMMIDNEDFQNFQINPMLKERVMAGIPCDFLIDDLETFGRTIENPIPVNGPYGEHTYLSRLRTAQNKGFIYHRLGSVDTIDKYEIISFDGKVREVLYFDMYHPRRSRQAVKGYSLVETPQAWTGFSHVLPIFPMDYFPEFLTAGDMTLFMADPMELWHHLDWDAGELQIARDKYCKSGFHTYCDHPVGTPQVQDEDLGGPRWDNNGEPIPQMERYIEEDDLGKEITFTWRDHVSQSEIEEANELHGFIVKTEGEITVEGEKFGWYPSKALAKRRKLDLHLMYDPAVTVLLEGFDVYRSLAPWYSASMNLTPKEVRFDKQGFFSTLEFDGYPKCEDFVDFLSNFYLPKRTYQMKVEKTALKDTFYVRWFSDVVGTYKVQNCEWKPLNESKLIGEFDEVGNITFKF